MSKLKHLHSSQEWVWTCVPGKLSHQLRAAGGNCGFSTDRDRWRRKTAEALVRCFPQGSLWARPGTGIASFQLQTKTGLKAQPHFKGGQLATTHSWRNNTKFVAIFNPLLFSQGPDYCHLNLLASQVDCCLTDFLTPILELPHPVPPPLCRSDFFDNSLLHNSQEFCIGVLHS